MRTARRQTALPTQGPHTGGTAPGRDSLSPRLQPQPGPTPAKTLCPGLLHRKMHGKDIATRAQTTVVLCRSRLAVRRRHRLSHGAQRLQTRKPLQCHTSTPSMSTSYELPGNRQWSVRLAPAGASNGHPLHERSGRATTQNAAPRAKDASQPIQNAACTSKALHVLQYPCSRSAAQRIE